MFFHIFLEDDADSFGDDRVNHLSLIHLMASHEIEFEFAKRRGMQMSKIADAWHCGTLAELNRASACTCNHCAPICSTESCTHSRCLINEFALSRGDRNFLDHTVHEWRHDDREISTEIHARFLPSDGNACISLAWIMRDNGAADAIL